MVEGHRRAHETSRTTATTAHDRRRAAKRVLVVGQLDGYANGVRAVEIVEFLRRRGHEVELVDSYYLARAGPDAARRKLPPLQLRRAGLYAVEVYSALLTRGGNMGRRHLSYYEFVANYRLRRAILRRALPLDDFDLVICETPYDAGLLTVGTSARTLYDCPTPWADELYYEGRLTSRQHGKLRRLEAELFDRVEHLAFHWETYAQYAVDSYGISGRNIIKLNCGCNPAAERAVFSDPIRVVYLGSLSSRFIDLPLLSRLAKQYPRIDVYGGPPPDPAYGLNYIGYAEPDILKTYQLGLVTCTRDELRRDGFSAKHLQYLAYGLPVLVPAWRRHLDLIEGSVPYDEQTFLSVIAGLADESDWRRTSDVAYAQAQRLEWDKTLRPLEALLEDS